MVQRDWQAAPPPTLRERLRGQAADGTAPDGSEFRRLLTGERGQLAHFALPAGAVSRPVRHRRVEELWYVLAGRGALWRCAAGVERIVRLQPGLCVDVAPGTAFQFRADPQAALELLIATLPPWPGDDEAEACDGRWPVDPDGPVSRPD